MYKSTRHANPMWTYSPSAIGQYAAVSENEALKLVAECKSALLSAGLLDEPDFLNIVAGFGPLSYVGIINGRIRSGYAYLKRIGAPQSVLATVPTYFLIAPKLGKVLARLSACRLGDLPQGLASIHRHIEQCGAPLARPKLSSAAYRVPKSALSTPSGRASARPARAETNQAEKQRRLPRAVANGAVQLANTAKPAGIKAAALPGPQKHSPSVKREQGQGMVGRARRSPDALETAFAAALRAALFKAR